ncbi:arylalkylamine N-acetyltransferase-like 2 [Uranotaenia lowii]|uniref:arylalkylamine N-acetyltransferase-like 2 n=1 Tax=Uranotaenia lowii TaxID=190385 RepID=UPI00247A6B8E|nr:arylalkylamine N-acetyltransferase-like 2 [Uranotaenia lowii]
MFVLRCTSHRWLKSLASLPSNGGVKQFSNRYLEAGPRPTLEPSLLNGFCYRLATEEDRPKVKDGLERYFFPEDPFNCSHRDGSAYEIEDMDHYLGMLNNGIVILALDAKTNQLAGFLGATFCGPDHLDILQQRASNASTKKYKDIAHLLAHLMSQARVFDRFEVDQAYHFQYGAVNPKFRGNTLTSVLMQKHVQLALSCGVRVFSADCSGPFAARSCERIGMECVYKLPYTEYRNEQGQQVFQGRLDYTEMRSYVLKV